MTHPNLIATAADAREFAFGGNARFTLVSKKTGDRKTFRISKAKDKDDMFFASEYFDQIYEWAIQLIEQGDAYVCDLSQDEMRDYRGTLTRPGKDSPYRDRSIDENLDLFEKMRAGEFPDGSRVLLRYVPIRP